MSKSVVSTLMDTRVAELERCWCSLLLTGWFRLKMVLVVLNRTLACLKASLRCEKHEGRQPLNSMWDDFTSCCIWRCLWTDVSSENWGNYIITACVTDVSTHYHVRIHKGCCHTLMVGVWTSEDIHLASLLHHMPRICSLWGVCGGQAGNIFPHCVPSFPSGTICCLSSLCSNQLTAYAEWPAAWGCVCVRVCMEAGDGMWWTSEHVFLLTWRHQVQLVFQMSDVVIGVKEESVWCFHLIAETCRKDYSEGKCTSFIIVALL